MKLFRIHLAACMCFYHVLYVICYRSRLRPRAALIVGQRMKVVATVTRWATIFLQMIVWMKASVWIAPTMLTECWSQRYIFCLPTAQKLIKPPSLLVACWGECLYFISIKEVSYHTAKHGSFFILVTNQENMYRKLNDLHNSLIPNVSQKRFSVSTFLTIYWLTIVYLLPFWILRVCWRLNCSLLWSILGALLVVITMPTLNPSVMASGTVSMINMLARSAFGFELPELLTYFELDLTKHSCLVDRFQLLSLHFYWIDHSRWYQEDVWGVLREQRLLLQCLCKVGSVYYTILMNGLEGTRTMVSCSLFFFCLCIFYNNKRGPNPLCCPDVCLFFVKIS